MKLRLSLLLLLSVTLMLQVHAYEVWTSCIKIPRSVMDKPETSENIRNLMDGVNLNFVSFSKAEKETLNGSELPMRTADWKKFFESLKPTARRGLQPIPRTHVYHETLPVDRPSLEEKLTDLFAVNNRGYEIGILMPYDNYYKEIRDNGKWEWSIEEFKEIRNWLNANGYDDVRLARDIRNFAADRNQIREEVAAEAIQTAVFEGNPTTFYENKGKRQDMLEYFIKSTDPKVQKLKLMFQMPVFDYGLSGTPYQEVRKFVRWIGENYGYEVLQGDRITFQFTIYNISYPWYPELNPTDETKYNNSIYGTALSLIEQKDLFSGKLKNSDGSMRKPTEVEANSYERELGAASVSEIGMNPSLITIYPNPATNVVNIRTKVNGNISIYDITGNIVKTYARASRHESPIKIDTSTLPNGIYFVVINTGNKGEVVKSLYVQK